MHLIGLLLHRDLRAGALYEPYRFFLSIRQGVLDVRWQIFSRNQDEFDGACKGNRWRIIFS